MEDLTGKQLGRYRIVSPVGEGGMAAVYKAYQPGMDRYVALKVLPQQYAQDAEFTGRFEQEAKVIAKLQHPHVLPVHDYGEADSYTYIVMPLVETGTLSDLLRSRTPLSLPRMRIIITQVGDALDYAHSQGLIHRDVKPSNILIDNRGNCLLTDFGIAKMVEGTKHFTQTGGIVGTPHYLSPEQGGGDPMTHRSDVYSLGVVLYEMATGRVPFDAETPMAVVIKHMTDPLPTPSKANPEISPALESVILKATAKPPGDRFESAAAMVRALRLAIPEAAVAREPSQVGTVPTEDLAEAEAGPRGSIAEAVEGPSQARRLAPWLVGVAALAAVAICGLGAFGIARLVAGASSSAATEVAQVEGPETPLLVLPTAGSFATAEGETDGSTQSTLGRAALHNASPAELPSARWPISIADGFDTNENQWSPFQISDEFGERSFTFQNGRYRWDVLPSRTFSVHDTPQMNLISDFVFSVDVEQLKGPDSAEYGVVFSEAAADVFYNFRISDTRQYSLQMNNRGTWSTLLDWAASPAIVPGAVNRITVVAEDGTFTFFINDQYVDEIADDTLLRGRVGMVVNLYDPGIEARWEFDNFELRQPWTAAVIDNFEVASGLWNTDSTISDDLVKALEISDGSFRWSLECQSSDFGCRTSSDLDGLDRATDFELKVDALRVEGPTDAEYGVRVRDDGENYIEFVISDVGVFSVALWHNQELDFYYLDTPAQQIVPGETNRLTVSAEGPSLAFYINGLQVGEILEELLPAGSFALSAEVSSAGQATFEFDNFKVRTP